ncbi:hypothetical protein FNV43_RR09585 [Rhamnella rubrinervis]|uniref:NB-ARC domain-containing protein n=1 Tax=Rhamnella rubrinervis TaxID=2594499 RepID=A0A8K0HAZ4_9ROSA|nr:hypothetical protein FNV43_RR09585 [Rhamnella rubrinervis]
MAQTTPFSVANGIIRRLEEIQNLRCTGLDVSLQRDKHTISNIQRVLLDEENRHDDVLVINCLRETGNFFYDVDDLVDEYYVQTLRDKMTKQVCSLFISTSNFSNAILKHRVQVLKKRLAAISAAARTLEVSLTEAFDGVGEIDATELTSADFSMTGQIIGMDGYRNVITQRLFENTKDDMSVQAICGAAGSGKGELAWSVFNSEIVRKNFQLRMWVELAPEDSSDLRLVIKKIINSAAPPHKQIKSNPVEMEQLQKRLHNEIKGKKFLLVFHGLKENWSVLKELLTNGVKGNNIVLVTRREDTAHSMSGGRVLKLFLLSYEESWVLFNQVAVKQRQEPWNNEILDRVGNIVDLCKGRPFIISIIGRMLYFKDPEKELSLLDELENIFKEENDIFPLLILWYNLLPSHLKHCFAFSSLFPKGYEMDVQTLIKFWMAQGFIESSDSQCMEDVGYLYCLQLLFRLFFQISKKDELGKITKCRLHGVMYGLAKWAAGNECNMLQANEAYASQVFPRHVSFNFPLDSSWPEIPSSVPQAKGIRTILLCNQSLNEFQERSSRKSICDRIVSRFTLLRMLDLHNSGLKDVPSSIGKLKHLSYLDLSENKDIVELPASITMLQNLQTLKLSSCYGLREWPKGFRKLVNLRHLEFDWCYNLIGVPRGLGQLSNLQTLSEVVLTKGPELRKLGKLKDLRGALKITKLGSGIQSESAKLGEKQHLSSLTLTWDFISNDGHATEGVEQTLEGLKPHQNLQELALVGYEGTNFSSWLFELKSLVRLSLRRCKCRYLPLSFSILPSLKVLILDEMTNLEYIYESLRNDHSGFRNSLQELRLSELPNLRGWFWHAASSASSSMFTSFPRLSKLIIEDCPKLNIMPLYPNLEEWLVLDNTSWKPFKLTLRPDESSSLSSSPALSKLRTLCIVGIEELDKSNADEIDWKAFESLHFLRLDFLPKLEVLPDGLQHVISLKELHIWRCNIETIPEWISNLRSLKRLSILVCPYLTSLPQGICSLAALETLEIVECPILLQRCQREIGADWDKIAHIENLLFPQLQSFSLISSLKNRKSLSKQKTNLSSTTEPIKAENKLELNNSIPPVFGDFQFQPGSPPTCPLRPVIPKNTCPLSYCGCWHGVSRGFFVESCHDCALDERLEMDNQYKDSILSESIFCLRKVEAVEGINIYTHMELPEPDKLKMLRALWHIRVYILEEAVAIYSTIRSVHVAEQTEITLLPSAGEIKDPKFDFHLDSESDDLELLKVAYSLFESFKGLIIGFLLSTKLRESSQNFFLQISADVGFRLIEYELSFMYHVLHTKANVVRNRIGLIFRFITFCFMVVAFILFHFIVKKDKFGNFDVSLTYALLIGAISLDMISGIKLVLSDWILVAIVHKKNFILECVFKRRRWSGSVSQYNMVAYCLHERWIWNCKWLDSFRGMIDKIKIFVRSSSNHDVEDLKRFIFDELSKKSSEANSLSDAMEACSQRGDWALLGTSNYIKLKWTVSEFQYAESLLLWHIATEICYQNQEEPQSGGNINEEYRKYRTISKVLSDYMFYLLIMKSEMLKSLDA